MKKEQKQKERKLDMHTLMCACGGKCEGTCRDEHLERTRTWSNPENVCPEAYNERGSHAKS